MQSILFIMKYFIDNNKDNLSFKFKNQVQSAKNMGLDVWYFAFNKNNIFLVHNNEKHIIFSYRECKINSLLNSIRLYIILYKAIPKVYSINNFFDVVYFRSMTATPSMLKSLKMIKKNGGKVIIEIPTYPGLDEDKSEKRLVRKILMKYKKTMDKYRNKYVDLYTLIGENADNYMGKPALNIDNGICLDFITKRKPEINNNEIHCIGLASMSRWHGYDRFIQGLFDYKKGGGNKKIILHLVGDGGDGSLQRWRKLSFSCNLENEVIFEGALYGDKLNRLVNLCDIGIGSLAGYRVNRKSSSALKNREYTARGLPFIYAVKDKGLKNELVFALKVPNDDSPIDMNSVIEFVKDIRSKKGIINEMRKYAQENMSWEKQFGRILDKLGFGK